MVIFFGVCSETVNFLLFFLSVVSLLGLSFPSISLCRAAFVERYCLNLVLSWNILVSPSMVTESFVGYSNSGWHFLFF